MKRRRVRVAAVTGAALVAFLTVTSSAFAHAALSPPVAETGVLQQFTLAVPTEKAGRDHDRDPADRALRSRDRLVRARAGLEAHGQRRPAPAMPPS